MSISTSVDYAASSRYIRGKLEIYFDTAEPTVIDKDTHLVSFEVLNELGVVKTSPEHELTSNLLTATIYNENRKFSPENPESPFYGKIVKGVKIVPYIGVGDKDWDELGTFYVTDWAVEDDALLAVIEAHDSMYDFITDDNVTRLPVMRNSVEHFLPHLLGEQPFTLLGNAVQATIPYLFVRDKRYNAYNEICNSQSWFSNIDRQEVLRIGTVPYRSNTVTINDDTQLISATIPPAFIRQYDDVTLSYALPSVLNNQQLANMSGIDLVLGENTFNNVEFTRDYILSVDNCYIQSANNISVVLLDASSRDMTLIVDSKNAAGPADIKVFGSTLNLAKLELPGEGSCLAITNNFVQSEAAAIQLRNRLRAYVASLLPVVELDLRGDPHILLGDMITVNSDFYKLNFTGVVIGIDYVYEGGFSSHVVLMNSNAIGG